jgi:uncharacterized protein YndB with AHSA1/START domain
MVKARCTCAATKVCRLAYCELRRKIFCRYHDAQTRLSALMKRTNLPTPGTGGLLLSLLDTTVVAMSSTRMSRHINASRTAVYYALLDPRAVATWKVPTGMTSHVHEFDAREGGSFRISLTYDPPNRMGKTSAHTDTYHGRFVKLLPNEQVVEVAEFETTDPDLRGEMKITITLVDADGGTDINAIHEGLPPGVSAADNELGWRSALAKLAAWVEAD